MSIDTVKQAEVFAAIRETYNIPRDPNLKLREFPTLARVIQFVHDRRPDLMAPAPPSAPVPVAAAAIADPVQDHVLALIVEKTGYPRDMLDLDLDLEADLGIDTVKQAEVFAAIRETYNIPRDPNLKLREFPTLARVIQFVHERRPDLVPTAPEETPPAQEVMETGQAGRPTPLPRRVPVPGLRPPLQHCKTTGVPLQAGRRVAIMPDRGGVAEALSRKLRSLGVEVLTIEEAIAAGPVHGVYWLPALDHEGNLADLTTSAWHEAVNVRLKSLYAAMRALYEQIAPAGTFLVSATRLGGQHGYDDAGAFAPLGGAVTGFTKTYKRERPDALVKAVDFEAERNADEVADLLIQETLRDNGAVEIGYKDGLRWTIGLEEQPAADGQPGLTLNRDSVFLITGAAGSIVSAITADLAAASGGTFHLLDLVPEPDAANSDLKRFATDKEGLKRDLFARMQARGERATPALVEKELAAIERAQSARSAIDAVRAAGGTVHYYSVNLTDAEAVAKVIGQVRQRSGRIDVLLHAAGLDRSHMLPDKPPAEFNLVFDVKSDGWFHLLRAIGDMPLGATVAFSSISGRFGNAGQTDYSSANDLLCKMTSNLRHTRPATRGIAIDWTAWGGIGMATRGSIPKMMELAGIDMMPPEVGVPWIRRELTAGGSRGEIVVGQRLGALLNEWDATGGVDTTAVAPGPMLGRVAGVDRNGCLTVETPLEPAMQPFLHDHQIEGTPLLPGVMGIEGFAEAALSMAPGWQVEAVEDVTFLAPFKFYRSEPRTVTIHAAFHPHGETLVADCGLTGSRSFPGQADPQITTHFTGRVRLAKQLREPAGASVPPAMPGPAIEAADIYRVYFHGPAYRVIQRAWWEEHRMVGEMALDLPGNHCPSEQPLAMAPRLIELCFQTAGLWEMLSKHRMGLPQLVHRVWLWNAPRPPAGPLYAVVTPDQAGVSFDAEVVDAAGTPYLHLSGYRTVPFREDVDTAVFGRPLAVLV